jgi:AraC-like DNA-binding protein
MRSASADRTERSDEARMWRIDELDGLEMLRASYGRFVFTPHAHEGFLIAVTEGGVGGPIYRGEQHQVGPGDVLVLNPEEAHAGGPVTGTPWRYRALYPNAGVMSDIDAEFSNGKRTLPEFPEGVVRDREAALRLRRFHVATEDPRSTLLERGSYFTEALVCLVGRYATRHDTLTSLGREHGAIRRARGYLDEHAEENVSLGTLAREARLSPFHLCRVFRREVGLTPHAYQEQVRVRRAKELLRAGTPIALAAADAGFYDQAHFTRRFKRILGVTPGEYVRVR